LADVDHGLLIAQVEHGPQMHGPALLVLLAFVLVAGVVALARKAAAQRRAERDRSTRAGLVRHENASDREPASDRGHDPRAPSGRSSA
jgi:hypothetical protein